MMPSGIAIGTATSIAANASSKVAGIRSGDGRGDRLVGPERRAEVAAHGAADKRAVLREQRTIESEPRAQLRDVLRRRALAKHRLHRVAGDQVNQREHERGDADQDRDGQEQSANQESRHAGVSSSAIFLFVRGGSQVQTTTWSCRRHQACRSVRVHARTTRCANAGSPVSRFRRPVVDPQAGHQLRQTLPRDPELFGGARPMAARA